MVAMKQEIQEMRTDAPDLGTDDSETFIPSRGPAEQLEEVLLAFRENVDGVRGVAIADRSGLPVAASFSTRANVLTVSAMATLAIQSSQRVYENLALAGPSEVVMAGPDSTVFVYSVSEGHLSVIAVLDGFANLGLVRIEVERLSRQLSEILGL
jgi:predicted regulator of Ras-like GTPase activity (Roadblock/LC7/MglB family)